MRKYSTEDWAGFRTAVDEVLAIRSQGTPIEEEEAMLAITTVVDAIDQFEPLDPPRWGQIRHPDGTTVITDVGWEEATVVIGASCIHKTHPRTGRGTPDNLSKMIFRLRNEVDRINKRAKDHPRED